jgi:hypothetical protein
MLTEVAQELWSCHCCTAKNDTARTNCRVCGRPESYALQGYGLPLHGKNATLFRPSQTLTVLENIHEVDSEQWSSLHSACAGGNYAIVKELLGFKAKIEARTNKGQTPLHLAVYSGSLECVRELLKYHADVNVSTLHEKATPLHIACQRQGAQIAQLLIHHGADVNARNIIQRTPLHLTAETGRVDVGNLLLTSGADKDALDLHGWSARQIAELNGHREFQELIIRECMVEKQVIIKELPSAEWHSDLWFQVSRMHNERTAQHQAVETQRKENDVLLASLAKSRQDKIIAQRREERRKEMELYHEQKNAVKAIAQQYHEKLENMRRKSILMRAQEALVHSKPATPNEKALRLHFGGNSKPSSAAALTSLAPPFSRQSSAAGVGPTLTRQNTSNALSTDRSGVSSAEATRRLGREGSSSQLAAMDLSKGYPFPLPSRLSSAGLNTVTDSSS